MAKKKKPKEPVVENWKIQGKDGKWRRPTLSQFFEALRDAGFRITSDKEEGKGDE